MSHVRKFGIFSVSPWVFQQAADYKHGTMRGFWVGKVVICWHQPTGDHSRKPGQP